MFDFFLGEEKINIESIVFNSSMEKLCRNYEVVTYNDYFFKNKIDENEIVTIKLNDELIATCYIDEVIRKKSLSGSSIVFRGRSKVCDLVDSNSDIFHKKNISLYNLAREFGKLFKIRVIDRTKPVALIPEVSYSVTDTIFGGLSKYAKEYNLILSDNADGNLVIDDINNEVVAKFSEQDFSEISYIKRNSNLHSKYLTFVNGKNNRIGGYVNKDIRYRYRGKEIDKEKSKKELDRLSKREYEIQKTKSEEISVTSINRFLDDKNKPFRINALIRLDFSETFGINEFYRITGVKFSQNKTEIRTDLTIRREDAFNLQDGKEGIK